jgi:hypothetical protein
MPAIIGHPRLFTKDANGGAYMKKKARAWIVALAMRLVL